MNNITRRQNGWSPLSFTSKKYLSYNYINSDYFVLYFNIVIIIKHKEKGCSHHFHVELERNLSTQMVAISKIKEEIEKLKKIPTEQQLLTLKNRKTKMIRVLKDEDSVEEVYLTDERNHKFTLRRSKLIFRESTS